MLGTAWCCTTPSVWKEHPEHPEHPQHPQCTFIAHTLGISCSLALRLVIVIPEITYGYLWLPMATYGYLWLPTATYETVSPINTHLRNPLPKLTGFQAL
jgi:hypothetical protein